MAKNLTTEWSSSLVLKKISNGGHTYRPFWNIYKHRRPGYSRYRQDATYSATTSQSLDHIDWLCEIGSDVGRSTAWLSSIALNIDVYEQDTGYIDLCKLQCLRHQEKYGPITNVNWYDTGELNIIEVLNRLNRKYDCIKITTLNVVEYVPTLLENLKQGGFLLIQEYGGQETKAELVKVLQRRYDLDIRRLDLALFVAEHK